MTRVVSPEGLDDLVQLLRAERRVIGPLARDGVITHDDITGVADLPKGWGEEQSPGRYRLVQRDDEQLFGFSAPSTSWKSYVFPERTLLISARRTNGTITIEEPTTAVQPTVFFGIRSCDLAGLGVLDAVFDHRDAKDPTYAALTADVFIVAVACSTPASTCFCASMDTGPTPTSRFDISVRELTGDRGLEYVLEAGSPQGQDVIDRLSGERVEPEQLAEAQRQHDAAVAQMTRRIDPADPPLAAAQPDHEVWGDIAERCLSCGNCTMVCPTCFCSTTEDSTALDQSTADRSRVWESCFSLDHSALHDGAVRDTTSARYRQWMLHKLVTWHDQFDMSGCVGCGRCISWCPVGIDLTVEVARLAAPARSRKGPPSHADS